MPFVPTDSLRAPVHLVDRGVRALARMGQRAVCGIYNSTPDWLVDRTTPGGYITAAFLDDFCSDPNDPAPPPYPPLQGGQCPVLYRLYVKITFTYINGAAPYTYSEQGSRVFYGRIKGIKIFNNVASSQWQCSLLSGSAADANAVVSTGLANSSNVGVNYPRIDEFRVVRQDGLADNCAAPLPTPNTLPPPISVLNPTYNFYTRNTIIPITLSYIPVNVDINAPVDTLFRFDAGGFTIDINFDGININFGSGDPTNPYPYHFPNGNDPRPQPPTPFSPIDPTPFTRRDGRDLSDDVLDIANDVNLINDKIDDLLDCDRCIPEFTISTITYGKAQSREQSIQPEGEYVIIDLIDIPANARVQDGDNSRDVYYAGWASYIIGGRATPRMPIHYKGSCFITPHAARGFSYTLYDGFSGSMIEAYRDNT